MKKNLDKNGLQHLWDGIKEKYKDVVRSKDNSIKNWETVTQDEFNNLKNSNQLVEGTVYNVLDSSIVASTSTPVGASIVWYGPEETIPNNYMREDGRLLNKNDYLSLFNTIGYTYGGSGDSFKLPDSRGRVNVHIDENIEQFAKLNNRPGTVDVPLTTDEMPANAHNDIIVDGTKLTWVDDAAAGNSFPTISTHGNSSLHHIRTDYAGGNPVSPHNNVQPSIAPYRIIKVKEEAYTEDLRSLERNIDQLNNELLELKSIKKVIPTIENGWSNYGSGYSDICYYKQGNFVLLRGLARVSKDVSYDSAPIFTLNEGYRPTYCRIFNQRASIRGDGTGGDIRITSDGLVYLNNYAGSNDWVSLDGIIFEVE